MSVEITTEKELETEQKAKNWIFIAYMLHALIVFFVFTPILAGIISYWKRNDAKDSWLESHVYHQISMFWLYIKIQGVAILGLLALLIPGVGKIIFAICVLVVLGMVILFIFRVLKGVSAFLQSDVL